MFKKSSHKPIQNEFFNESVTERNSLKVSSTLYAIVIPHLGAIDFHQSSQIAVVTLTLGGSNATATHDQSFIKRKSRGLFC